MVRMLVFGASITWGAWDIKGGWVQRLRKYVDKNFNWIDDEFYCEVYNLGISGDTSEDLLQRFEFEIKQRDKEDRDEIILIISIGVNDSQFMNQTKSRRTTSNKFRKNLQELIKIAKKYSSKIIFVGFSPVVESEVDPIPWAPDKSYKNEYVKEFDSLTKEICDENKVYFIEIFDKFMEKDYKKLLDDGIHPNTEGHKMIFEIVKDSLLEKGIIPAEKIK